MSLKRVATFRLPIVAIIITLIVLLINVLIKEPALNTIEEKATFAFATKNYDFLESIYFEQLQSDTLNAEYHFDYIYNHFQKPLKYTNAQKAMVVRNDEKILQYYYQNIYSSNQKVRNLALLGYGFCMLMKQNTDEAFKYFNSIDDAQLPYVNNFKGFLFYEQGETDSAIYYFKKEITISGNVDDAYDYLIRIYYAQQDYFELFRYYNNPSIKEFIPFAIEKNILLHKKMFFQYIAVVFKAICSNLSVIGFIAALLILIIYIYFIRSIDIFKPEKWKNIITVSLFGMFFSIIAIIIYDILFYFNIRLTQNVVNDFFYCWLAIGGIEELVKIIPLLLILKFKNIINESTDYLVYACAAALGFSFMENLIYLDSESYHLISGRALIATVAHMVFSSIIAYGFILNQYKRHYNPVLNFIIFFAIASFAHGFYDFWLINADARQFSMITFIFFMLCIFAWNTIINNTINQSVFFNEKKKFNIIKVETYVLFSLTTVMLFEFIALVMQQGPTIGTQYFISSIISGAYIILILSFNMSHFFLRKGKWNTLGSNIETSMEINYDEAIGKIILLHRVKLTKNAVLVLPNKVTIMQRYAIAHEHNYYLAELSRPINIAGFKEHYLVIRPKEENNILYEQTHVAVFLVSEKFYPETDELNHKNLRFCSWALMKFSE